MDTWRSTAVKTYSRKRKHSTYLADFDQQDEDGDVLAASSLPSPPLSSSPIDQRHTPTATVQDYPTPSTPFHNTIRRQQRKARKLTQLTIDLGKGNTSKQCPGCGMEYVPTNPEDVKTHKDFHSASMGGISVPAGVAAKWKVIKRVPKRLGRSNKTSSSRLRSEQSDCIIEIGQNDASAVQKLAKTVLEIAEQDLGAVGIGDTLWSNVQSPKRKVFLYVQENKSIGLCLAERIKSASPVQQEDVATPSSSSSICTALERVPATLGISRIWVSREFRGLGIARQLLDTARQEFDYGLVVSLNKVAFSQPTNSGAQLARAWFGKEHGWLVYENHEEQRNERLSDSVQRTP